MELNIYQTILDGLKVAQKLNKIPAFAYDRISDKVQEGGISLEYQESFAGRYASYNNLHVVNYFTITESAKQEGRKVFNQMIELALQFGVKDLIFKNTDRMSRNYQDLLKIEKLYEEQNFNIHFYQTFRVLNSKSTYADRFVMAVEIAAARQLSDKLKHDTIASQQFKANQGIAPLGSPIGYKYLKKERMHVIDKEKENFMHFFFDEFDTGKYTLKDFGEFLNGKKYKSSKGFRWEANNVYATVTNVFYHGEFSYVGKIWPGKHEPYYPKSRYEERLKRMHMNFAGVKYKEIDYVFRKFLKCAKCNKTLTGDLKKNQFTYYVHDCINPKKRIYIPESDIVEMIDNQIKEIEYSEQFGEFLKKLFRETVKIKRNDHGISATGISRKISELELKQDKLLDLLMDDEIDRDALKRQFEPIKKEIDRLESERKVLKTDKNDFIFKVSDQIDYLRKIPRLYSHMNNKEKAELLRSMASHIIIEKEKAQIHWIKPYSFTLHPDIIRHKESVITSLVKLPQLNKIITEQSFLFQLYLAA